ncbi:hypothetical protein [Streptacidiphilus anmyonensis]|uniref:hypothetical protein n=1 Tax=Streptacidiphilus anmyonensis TaxID=405782 RepID=UPI000693D1AC|nr:hypothetical protein [Streptacidiphilus anmyonensis]
MELHGRFHGAGSEEPVYTVRRSDGQVVELSQLLYHVVCAVDGHRTSEQVAARVSASYGREVDAEDVEFLVAEKLRPLGVTVLPGDDDVVAADAPSADLLLSLKGRSTLLPPRAVWALTGPLTWLHAPLVVVVVLAGFAAADLWLFLGHGAVSALASVLDRPGALLAVLALVVASLVFHELGHASACRFGGARPGRIGFGIYLLWPSFFTDVTDIYRRPRADRLRTDLGGVYFNLVFMLALFTAYAATRQPVLLAAVYMGHYEVLEQLIPVVRLDGYYILADLAGVPDLFGQIRPVLRSVLRREPSEVAHLARRSRILVTVWVLASTAMLAAQVGSTVFHLPGILSQGVTAMAAQARVFHTAATAGDMLTAVAAVVRFLFLLLPLAATLYLLLRLGNALRKKLRSSRQARTVVLALAAGAALGAAGTVSLAPAAPLPSPSPGGTVTSAPGPRASVTTRASASKAPAPLARTPTTHPDPPTARTTRTARPVRTSSPVGSAPAPRTPATITPVPSAQPPTTQPSPQESPTTGPVQITPPVRTGSPVATSTRRRTRR